MTSSIIQALLKIKIQPNMSEQEKKLLRIYYLFNTETKPKKKSEIIGVSLWSLNPPWLHHIVRFRKQNKCNFPIILWEPIF